MADSKVVTAAVVAAAVVAAAAALYTIHNQRRRRAADAAGGGGGKPKLVYRISTRADWAEATRIGEFVGAAIDKRDGYIHFSHKSQVEGTADLYFKGQTNLVVLVIEVDPLGDKLVFEPSGAAERADQLFPHLYGGPMATSAVVDVIDLPWDAAAGKHVFPKDW